MALSVEDLIREDRAGKPDQQVLKEAQAGRTELLPNSNVVLLPGLHPKEHRLAQTRPVGWGCLEKGICPRPVLRDLTRDLMTGKDDGAQVPDVVGIIVAPSAKKPGIGFESFQISRQPAWGFAQRFSLADVPGNDHAISAAGMHYVDDPIIQPAASLDFHGPKFA